MSQGAKKTHQSRSKQTRDSLLKALEKLLETKDFADISVAEIAATAGVSPASVYRRFDKKQGFIPVLIDLYLERLREWSASPGARADIEKCTLRQALHRIAGAGWRQLQQQNHLMRAIYLHGRSHLDLLGTEGDQFESALLVAMQAIIALYAAEITHNDKDKAAAMLAYYFNNIFIERGLFKKQTGAWTENLSDQDFVEEVADFAYGYLTMSPRT